jgi:predicted CoA-binding protein
MLSGAKQLVSAMTSTTTILEFLSQQTFALVGASRTGKRFGNVILRSLKDRGYRVFPVNPKADVLEGEPCYPSLRQLPQPVDGLVVCVPPDQTEHVILEAIEAGIKRVWLQQGAESLRAVRLCEANAVSVVVGQCILMFAEPVRSIHRFHRWVWKLTRKLPQG